MLLRSRQRCVVRGSIGALEPFMKDSGRETSKLEGRDDFHSSDSHLRGSTAVNAFLLDNKALEAR